MHPDPQKRDSGEVSFSTLPLVAKQLIHDCRTAVTAHSNPKRALNELIRLGFSTMKGGKNGHHRLAHPLLGAARLSLASSPSDRRWTLGFVRELRYAALHATMNNN